MRVIIAQWNNGVVESYTSIKKFTDVYPNYKVKTETIMTYLTRKKKSYVDEFVVLTRVETNKKQQ